MPISVQGESIIIFNRGLWHRLYQQTYENGYHYQLRRFAVLPLRRYTQVRLNWIWVLY